MVTKTYPCDAFDALCDFCKVMCDDPRLIAGPIYGGNDWYCNYGDSSAEKILRHARRIVECAPKDGPRPYMVIDDGWQVCARCTGPWYTGNQLFGDMGVLAKQIEEMAGGDIPVMRIMPNTPVAIGCGVIMYCKNGLLTAEDEQALVSALSPAGIVDPLEERRMDAGSALCGCSPAFTDLYMEALADGAVACGIPRAKALKYAAAAVAGAAQLALETGEHPGALKDKVCSPGGSTIQGVRTLENRAFRGAVMEAVIAAAGASGDLGKK
jgi:hypothetical protein